MVFGWFERFFLLSGGFYLVSFVFFYGLMLFDGSTDLLNGVGVLLMVLWSFGRRCKLLMVFGDFRLVLNLCSVVRNGVWLMFK